MKTSNKILFGLLALILLSITVTMVAMRSNIYGDEAEGEKSGKAEQQRNLSAFNKIDIESKFTVHYTQDTFQRVVVKADSNLVDWTLTEVKDGRLFIHSKKRIRSNQHIDVYVTNDSINEVNASAGAKFETLGKMKVTRFKADGSAGAIFKMDVLLTDIKLDFSAGSIADLSGSCQNLIIESSAGSILNATDLIAKNASVEASAGSMVNINVTSELSVEANAGAMVKYQGNPQLKNIDISSGAQLHR